MRNLQTHGRMFYSYIGSKSPGMGYMESSSPAQPATKENRFVSRETISYRPSVAVAAVQTNI